MVVGLGEGRARQWGREVLKRVEGVRRTRGRGERQSGIEAGRAPGWRAGRDSDPGYSLRALHSEGVRTVPDSSFLSLFLQTTKLTRKGRFE